MSRTHKDKYENTNPRRSHTIMSSEDAAAGKKSNWPELEITGKEDFYSFFWYQTLKLDYIHCVSLFYLHCEKTYDIQQFGLRFEKDCFDESDTDNGGRELNFAIFTDLIVKRHVPISTHL